MYICKFLTLYVYLVNFSLDYCVLYIYKSNFLSYPSPYECGEVQYMKGEHFSKK